MQTKLTIISLLAWGIIACPEGLTSVEPRLEAAAHEVSTLLEKARQYSVAGDFEHAYNEYEQILKLSPGQWQAEVGLARSAMQLGQIRRSCNILTRLSKQHPNEPKIWLNLAIVKLETGEFEDADAAAKNAVMLDKNSATAVRVLAEVKYQSGQYDFAKELAVMLLENQPANRDNYLFMLKCMGSTKSVPEELNVLIDLAEKYLPTDSSLFYILGHRAKMHALAVRPLNENRISSKLLRRKQAWLLVSARALQTAISQEPASAKYHLEYSKVLAMAGSDHAAAKELSAAQKLDPKLTADKKTRRSLSSAQRDAAGRLKQFLWSATTK